MKLSSPVIAFLLLLPALGFASPTQSNSIAWDLNMIDGRAYSENNLGFAPLCLVGSSYAYYHLSEEGRGRTDRYGRQLSEQNWIYSWVSLDDGTEKWSIVPTGTHSTNMSSEPDDHADRDFYFGSQSDIGFSSIFCRHQTSKTNLFEIRAEDNVLLFKNNRAFPITFSVEFKTTCRENPEEQETSSVRTFTVKGGNEKAVFNKDIFPAFWRGCPGEKGPNLFWMKRVKTALHMR